MEQLFVLLLLMECYNHLLMNWDLMLNILLKFLATIILELMILLMNFVFHLQLLEY